jgi:hypothetical protein
MSLCVADARRLGSFIPWGAVPCFFAHISLSCFVSTAPSCGETRLFRHFGYILPWGAGPSA